MMKRFRDNLDCINSNNNNAVGDSSEQCNKKSHNHDIAENKQFEIKSEIAIVK